MCKQLEWVENKGQNIFVIYKYIKSMKATGEKKVLILKDSVGIWSNYYKFTMYLYRLEI